MRKGSYKVTGKIERTDNTTLLITELPIGKWTQDNKTFLDSMMTGSKKSPSEISDFKENHTDITVSFTVTSVKDKIDVFEKGKDDLLRKFKLSTTISTKNMTLLDDQGKFESSRLPSISFVSSSNTVLSFTLSVRSCFLKRWQGTQGPI